MPYRIDLFAIFIFLGIVQALFLCVFFFSNENRKIQANAFQGFLLLAIAACLFEIFLMYTGYIVNAFYLVDFSESMGLAVGPLFYLVVRSRIQGKLGKIYYLHLIPFVFYSFVLMQFLLLPEDAKYNAWVCSYRPELPYRLYEVQYDVGLFRIKSNITEITLFSIFVYAGLSLRETIYAFRKKKESFWNPTTLVLRDLRTSTFIIVTLFITILIVKLTNKNDMGDHIFASYAAITIYFTSFNIIRHSGFFKQADLSKPSKYKSSSLSVELQESTLTKLKVLMENEKPFLKTDFSLPDLASVLGISVHSLSQIINERLEKSFFDMTAEYRVNEAKMILKDKPHYKVEEVAELVGYNSKSSFNTTFKKITGMTPSEYRSV